MKRLVSLITGAALVLAFAGIAFAADDEYRKDESGNMIKNDDLDQYKLDRDRATVNQMPAEPGTEGSAPGGISPDTNKGDTDMTVAPEEKAPMPDVKKEEKKKSWDGY
jgi:hypothetical protein